MGQGKNSSSQAAWALLTEGVTSARLEAHGLRHLVTRGLKIVEQSSRGYNNGAGRASCHPLTLGLDGLQPLQHEVVFGRPFTPESTGNEHDVGAEHVVEEFVDVVASTLPFDWPEFGADTDQLDVGQLVEHERERLTLVR